MQLKRRESAWSATAGECDFCILLLGVFTDTKTGSTKTSTTTITPAPPTLALSAPDGQQRRTLLKRSPATRAVPGPSSVARRVIRHPQLELCSHLVYETHDLFLHTRQRRPRISGCLSCIYLQRLGRLTGQSCVIISLLAYLFVDFTSGFAFVCTCLFDTCPVHGTASLSRPKFSFPLLGHIDTNFLFSSAMFLRFAFPLSISICNTPASFCIFS